jgi:hypothetical protein
VKIAVLALRLGVKNPTGGEDHEQSDDSRHAGLSVAEAGGAPGRDAQIGGATDKSG